MNCNIKATRDSISETQRRRALKRTMHDLKLVAISFLLTTTTLVGLYFSCLKPNNETELTLEQPVAEVVEPPKFSITESIVNTFDYSKLALENAAKEFTEPLKKLFEKYPEKSDAIADMIIEKLTSLKKSNTPVSEEAGIEINNIIAATQVAPAKKKTISVLVKPRPKSAPAKKITPSKNQTETTTPVRPAKSSKDAPASPLGDYGDEDKQ